MSNWLIERFTTFGERPFLARGDQVYTYQLLADKIAEFQQQFANTGVSAGDVVTLETDYSLEAIAALFALFQAKAIAVPISPISEKETAIRRTEARATWKLCLTDTGSELTALPKELPPHDLVAQITELGHPGLVLFSSGSTGRPKAMIHDAVRLLEPFFKKRTRTLNVLIFLLFDHIGGLNTLFNGLACGGLIVVPTTRDATAVAQSIQAHQVKLLPASPTFLNLLLMSGAHLNYDFSSLRYITYGTEPMPESLLLRLKSALPQVNFIQTFGTSETGISQTVSRSSESTQIKIEDPNTEYKIVEGELWLRSKSQILGYLNHQSSRFTADGWFKTGDIVESADDGFITITGRREDIINVGGEKVTPSEVESVLLQLPEIADCLVYAEPNAITGQHVAAEIVPTADYDLKALKRTIKKHCRTALSAYKVPARIVFHKTTTMSDRFKKRRIKNHSNDASANGETIGE